MFNFLLFVFGKYFWIKVSNELKYKGHWKAGRFHGFGYLKYANGSEYLGYFVNGAKQGYGSYSSASGYKYKGGWHNGRQTGSAQIFYKNGDVYTGEVKAGLRFGYGTLYQDSTARSFAGNWIRDMLEGPIDILDENWIFKGTKDLKSGIGSGVLSYKDGSSYSGDLMNFKREGYGTLDLSNGDRICGIWSNNINVQSAKILDQFGFVWDGNLENMKPSGHMKTTRPDGIVYDSFWEDGAMLQSLSVRVAKVAPFNKTNSVVQ